MAKHKQTPVEKDYDRQRKRLKAAIYRAEKQGYILPENVLPDKPKRVTKASVRRLAQINPKDLREKGLYLFEDTGEVVKVKGNLKAIKADIKKKKEASKKATATSTDKTFFDRVIISNWLGTLGTFSSGEAYELLKAWFNTVLAENGEHNTAVMLQTAAEDGHLLTWEIVYKHDMAVMYIGYLMDYIPDQGVLYKEEMIDKLEFMKEVSNAFENSEDWEVPS